MGMMRMPGGPPGMYGILPGQLAGTVRSADEMNEGEESGEQLAKRQRVAKLPGGHLYPEQNWIDMHPVS
jgi:splicing factor 3A subunit 1